MNARLWFLAVVIVIGRFLYWEVSTKRTSLFAEGSKISSDSRSMSRCFPFPPPGYVNKASSDDLNLIIKEKDKDKKHKDKDKKERRERKKKERAEGEHKGDKDRKLKKHKDKKEKQKSSKENKIVGPPSENQNGEKPGPDNKLGNGTHNDENPVELGKRDGNGDGATYEKWKFLEEKNGVNLENQNGDKMGQGNKSGGGAHGLVGMRKEISNGYTKDMSRKSYEYDRIPVEMGKRVRNDEGDDDKNVKKQKSSDNIKFVRPSENQNCKMSDSGNKQANKALDHKNSVEMGSRVGNDDMAKDKTNCMKEKHKSSEDKSIAGSSEIRNSENPELFNYGSLENKVLIQMGKRVRADDGVTDNSYPISSNGHRLGVDAQCTGNNWVAGFSGEKRIKVGNVPCKANMTEKKNEGKEKIRIGNSVSEGDELKNKNRDKKKKEDKKKKKEDKVKSKDRMIKQRASDGNLLDLCASKPVDVLKRASDGNLLDLCASKPVDVLKESWDKQGRLPELEEQSVPNGLLLGNGTQPNNASSSAISSHQLSQNRNGSHHPCHKNTVMSLAVEKSQTLITNDTVNGFMLPPPQFVIKNALNLEPGPPANNSSPEPLKACIKKHEIGNGPQVQNGRRKKVNVNGVSEGNKVTYPRPSITKKPHPDLKYLSEILTVPKVGPPLFIDDDEEWLIGCKDAMKAKLGSSMVESTERVWSDAIRLEAADVIAMPWNLYELFANEDKYGITQVWLNYKKT